MNITSILGLWSGKVLARNEAGRLVSTDINPDHDIMHDCPHAPLGTAWKRSYLMRAATYPQLFKWAEEVQPTRGNVLFDDSVRQATKQAMGW